VRLGGHAHRHGGELHELGVGHLLPAEDDDRRRARQKRRQHLLVLPPHAQDADDDQRTAVDEPRDAGVV
jgi:hypothetical protein